MREAVPDDVYGMRARGTSVTVKALHVANKATGRQGRPGRSGTGERRAVETPADMTGGSKAVEDIKDIRRPSRTA